MFLAASQKAVVWGFVNGRSPFTNPYFSRFFGELLFIDENLQLLRLRCTQFVDKISVTFSAGASVHH